MRSPESTIVSYQAARCLGSKITMETNTRCCMNPREGAKGDGGAGGADNDGDHHYRSFIWRREEKKRRDGALLPRRNQPSM